MGVGESGEERHKGRAMGVTSARGSREKHTRGRVRNKSLHTNRRMGNEFHGEHKWVSRLRLNRVEGSATFGGEGKEYFVQRIHR